MGRVQGGGQRPGRHRRHWLQGKAQKPAALPCDPCAAPKFWDHLAGARASEEGAISPAPPQRPTNRPTSRVHALPLWTTGPVRALCAPSLAPASGRSLELAAVARLAGPLDLLVRCAHPRLPFTGPALRRRGLRCAPLAWAFVAAVAVPAARDIRDGAWPLPRGKGGGPPC